MKVNVLEWDSVFFQKKIGELVVNEDETDVEIAENFDVIYAKSNHNIDLEIKGFESVFSETKVIFSKKLDEVMTTNEHVLAFLGDKTDLITIYELAFESGKYSRFNLDSRFSKNEFKGLYKKWVDNSLVKKIADEVLVFRIKNEILGFVTYKIKEDIAVIGLLAITAKKQGIGIGTQLMNEVERKLKERGIQDLQIPTQLQNERACEFYKKRGYEVIKTTVIKHYWKI